MLAYRDPDQGRLHFQWKSYASWCIVRRQSEDMATTFTSQQEAYYNRVDRGWRDLEEDSALASALPFVVVEVRSSLPQRRHHMIDVRPTATGARSIACVLLPGTIPSI